MDEINARGDETPKPLSGAAGPGLDPPTHDIGFGCQPPEASSPPVTAAPTDVGGRGNQPRGADDRRWSTERQQALAYTIILRKAVARVSWRVRCPATAEALSVDVASTLTMGFPADRPLSLLDYHIYWAVRTAVSEYYRHTGHEQLGTMDGMEGEAEDTARHRAEATELADSLHDALWQLTGDQRTVFRFRYESELTHREIATELQITEAASRARLYRARRRLEGLLGINFREDRGD